MLERRRRGGIPSPTTPAAGTTRIGLVGPWVCEGGIRWNWPPRRGGERACVHVVRKNTFRRNTAGSAAHSAGTAAGEESLGGTRSSPPGKNERGRPEIRAPDRLSRPPCYPTAAAAVLGPWHRCSSCASSCSEARPASTSPSVSHFGGCSQSLFQGGGREGGRGGREGGGRREEARRDAPPP